MKALKILFFIILLISCEQNLVTESALIKDNSITDNSTQYYIYPKNLPGLFSTEYYKVKAYLNQKDSYLILFSHFNSFKIEDGIKIKIERNNKDLIITANVKNSSVKKLLEEKDYFLNQSEIDFTLRVSNSVAEGAFIRIWENFRIRSDIIKSERSTLTEETILTDSESINFYKQGEGLKWGLKLFHSQIIKGVRVSPPTL